MNSDKTEFMCFKQDVPMSTINDKRLKLVDHFTYVTVLLYGCTTRTNKMFEEKARWELHCVLLCTIPGRGTPQNSRCTATYLPFHKPYKKDVQDMMEKHRYTHQWDYPMDSNIWTYQCGPASLEDLLNVMDNGEGWQQSVKRIRAITTA